MEVDFNIGLVLKVINDAGIADNTIVILTGDNRTSNSSQNSSLAVGEDRRSIKKL